MNVRIAIVAHVFYDEIWPEVKTCIDNFLTVCGDDSIDVFLTYPMTRPHLASILSSPPPAQSWACRCEVVGVPNRGYDIGSFFFVLGRIDLEKYDYVVKLHTKRDAPEGWLNFRHYPAGPAHRRMLLSFCSTREAVAKSMQTMEHDPLIGMLAAWPLIDPSGVTAGFEVLDSAREVLARYGLPNNGRASVYGTMFMVRAELLTVLKDKVNIDDFPEVSSRNPHDVGVAGAWESAFGVLVEAQGFRVADRCISAVEGKCYALLYYCLRIVLTSVRKMAGSRIMDMAISILNARRFSRKGDKR